MRSANIGGVEYHLEALNTWDFRALSAAALQAARMPGPVFVEVGTLLATTSRALLAYLTNEKAPAVTYVGVDISDLAVRSWGQFCVTPEAKAQTAVGFWRKPSVEAAREFPDDACALVFVDACHCFNCAKADVAAWGPKVRHGGFLAFHDTNPLQKKRRVGVEQHPGAHVIGVGKALAAQAELLRSMGFKLVEIGKPPETMRKADTRAWTTVFRRSE